MNKDKYEGKKKQLQKAPRFKSVALFAKDWLDRKFIKSAKKSSKFLVNKHSKQHNTEILKNYNLIAALWGGFLIFFQNFSFIIFTNFEPDFMDLRSYTLAISKYSVFFNTLSRNLEDFRRILWTYDRIRWLQVSRSDVKMSKMHELIDLRKNIQIMLW